MSYDNPFEEPSYFRTEEDQTYSNEPAVVAEANFSAPTPNTFSNVEIQPSELLEIIVSTPEKVSDGIMSAHVSYKVSVKTTIPSFRSKEFAVMRRFKHFFAFREDLKEKYRGHLIPPLPEKTLMNRFNAEFMEYRRRELQRFLERVARHPVLRNSFELKRFLELENGDLLLKAKESPPPSNTPESGGFFSFLGINSTATQKEPDQWFDVKKNYISGLEAQLLNLEKATANVIRKQKELAAAYSDFAVASTLLSTVEADHDSWVAGSFTSLSEVSTQLAALNEKLTDNEFVYFEDGIRDYLRLIASSKEMLTARNEKLVTYQSCSKQFEGKKDKGQKGEVEALEKKMDESRNAFSLISDTCKTDLQAFEKMKAEDFKKMLTAFVKMNIDVEIQKVNEWKHLLKKLAD